MPLSLTCDCGARFEVEDALAGQTVSCPECQASLKAPATRRPVVRTSNFALASFILAIVGAFTVVGSIAAAVLGLIGVGVILRDRERQAGLGFAVTGVVLGVAFSAITLFGIIHLPDIYRSWRGGQLAAQIDKSVDVSKDLEIKQDGFTITKLAGWGQGLKESGDPVKDRTDPITRLLQPSDSSLLLIQPDLDAVVGVQVVNPGSQVDNIDEYIKKGVKPASSNGAVDSGRNTNAKPDPTALEVQEYTPIASRDSFEGDRHVHELIVRIKLKLVPPPLPTGEWTMLVHAYRSGNSLYILRGVTETRLFDSPTNVEDKLLEVMKTFKP